VCARRVTDLLNASFEQSPWKRIHRESDFLSHVDAADVRFGNCGFDLHLVEIVRDSEEGGSRHRGRNGLTGFDFASDDHAVNRRVDGGAAKVDQGTVEKGLAGLGLRL